MAAQGRADDVTIVRPPLASVVLDRRGGLLAEVGPEARSWVRVVDLPAYVGQAFVATEDHRFYQHDGVDVVGVMGALRDNLLRAFRGHPRGASTITQQLVGMMFPDRVNRREITLARKLREADLARALERHSNKSQILEAYLNYINFGHGWYGIESAARHFFGKSAAELTLGEVAVLAALPKSPVEYDPRAHPDRAQRRRGVVLSLMREQGYLTDAQARAAAAEPIRLASNDGYSVRAPYLVEWVRRWLVDRYGIATVNTGGLQVMTTVDPDLQAMASTALAQGLARVESAPGYRWPKYGSAAARPSGGRTPYLQGLMVALDPQSGDVLALIGGRDYKDSEFNRAVQGARQAGSAFKPMVYATALSHGVSPTAILMDTALSLRAGDGSLYAPENSDGTFRGPVTVREALVHSINVPTIRLGLKVGMDSVIATARRLGLSTPIPPFPPTAIGAADVRPIELVAAYSAFATLGSYAPPRVVTQVQDAHGTPIYESSAPQPRSVLDPRIAFQVTSMLQDVVRRGTGTGARRAGLPSTLPVAGKTGTTNDNADVWFIGYTPNLVAGVWLGFDRRQTIAPGAFGGTLAAPIWSLFAKSAYSRLPIPEPWQPPPGLVAVPVRRSDGLLVRGDSTPDTYTEYFLEGTEPTPRNIARRLAERVRLW